MHTAGHDGLHVFHGTSTGTTVICRSIQYDSAYKALTDPGFLLPGQAQATREDVRSVTLTCRDMQTVLGPDRLQLAACPMAARLNVLAWHTIRKDWAFVMYLRMSGFKASSVPTHRDRSTLQLNIWKSC